MKRRKTTSRLILFFCLIHLFCISAFAQEITSINYVDNFQQESTGNYINLPFRAKGLRKNAQRGGNIIIHPRLGIADSLKRAIKIAANLWEDYLPIGTELNIGVELGNVENDMETNVCLYIDSQQLVPSSIYRNLIKGEYVFDNLDAMITLSNTTNWKCNYGEGVQSGEKNLTTAMLRAIAITLGFGTTVVQKTGRNGAEIITFSESGNNYTPFEQLVYNSSGQALTSINRGNKRNDNLALRSYSQPADSLLVMLNNSSSYKLYAPTPFVKNRSMIFLDESSSLMHYNNLAGNKFLAIDDITLNILKEIGWDVETESMSIYCNEIPQTGIPSAYGTYTFRVNNYNPSIENTRWEYVILNNSQEYELVSQQTGGVTFDVCLTSENISSPYINSDGDIEGIVKLIYTLNGQEKVLTYSLTLECAPKILGILNQQAHFEGHFALYGYSFTVDYVGSQTINIGVEQEYSPYYDNYIVTEPYLAHAYIQGLSRGNMVWIDISVSNEYGSDLYTIELPVQSDTSTIIQAERKEPYIGHKIDHIDVYTPSGLFLGKVKDLKSIPQYHFRDFVLKYIDKNNNEIRTQTIKIK